MTADTEASRLRALADYQVLDTEPEETFDRLTVLAADLFGAPIALVSLIDAERQWFKSRHGVEVTQTPRSWAFCSHAIEGVAGSTFVVEDASIDPRFSSNPLVTQDPSIRFYAGAVLTGSDGSNLGTLCVLDTHARGTPAAEDLRRLRILARIVVDELELRRTSRIAREKQRQLSMAETLAGLGHWRLDAKTMGLEWSDQMYRIYGLEVGAPLELEPLMAMTDPRDAHDRAIQLKTQLETGVAADNAITRIRLANGELRYLASKSVVDRDETGAIVAVVGTVLDITEQKRAEFALAESEQRFRRLAVNAPDIISESELDGTLTYVSPASLAITGFAPEELVGRTCFSLMRPEDAERMLAMCQAVFTSKGSLPPQSVEYRARHKAGHEIWLESKPILRVDPDTGRFAGLTDVIRDITARKTLEADLRRAQHEAEAAAAVKAEFLANMSHELRTPLTSILGFTRLAAEQPELTALSRTYVNRVRDASDALLCTVNDILDFSRLEAGQVSFEVRPVSLAGLTGPTLELFGPQAGAKDLQLTLDGDDETQDLVICIDPDRLRQVLLNLVGNAVKFTEVGGVTLRTRYDRADQSLTVEVEDTGEGIAPAKLDRLFKRFSQVDGSLTRSHSGTGLGLAICKGLVEAMGGEIGVDSAEGQGSRFWFRIPAPEGDLAVAGDGGSAAVAPTFQGVRVLVADDHPSNRELARLFLAGVGAEVAEAEDGEEAVRLAQEQPFDVILMDMRMPRLDGVGALGLIRGGDGPNDATPILAFTANAEALSEADLEALGFQGVVAKPMDPRALITEVARATAFDASCDAWSQSHVG